MSDTPDITVDGWSARFARAFDHLLGVEGGFVDDPVDRGGATKYGISLRFLRAEGAFDEDADGFADFDIDRDGDIDGQDIRKLTVADARCLYLRCFWKPLRADELKPPIGEMLFDQAVNGGRRAAVKMLQRALNLPGRESLAVDGVLGRKTLARLDELVASHGMNWLVNSYRAAVKHRYRQIAAANPSQQRFLKGWLARADKLGRWS